MNMKYYYNGITLKEYCKINNLNYDTYLSRIKRILKREKISEQLAVQKALIDYENVNCLYYYDNMTLREYCQKHGFIYGTMLGYIKLMKKQNPNMENDKIVFLAIEYYKKNHIPIKKYFYHNQRLSDFCLENNYDYNYLVEYLSTYVKNSFDITDEEMQKAIYRHNIRNSKKIFKLLNENTAYDESILKSLKVDVNSIKLVMTFIKSFQKAILFVWYFGIEEDNITIDLNRIKEVYSNINHLDDLKLNELIGYYKAGIYDTREIIYQKVFLASRKIIYDLCNSYEIYNKDFINELHFFTDTFIISFIEETISRNLGQIINYMNAYIKGQLKIVILNELRNNKMQSLKDHALIKNDIIEEYDFSDEILNALNKLNIIEQAIIKLKYQKGYNDEEIAKTLNIPINKLIDMQKSILDSLKEEEILKRMLILK